MDQFNLGKHSRHITTTSADTQRWFNMGLNWCYGFNQEEGVACFRKALEFDPDCAMAYWGIAYGSGPFYNRPWRHLGADEADLDQCTRLSFDGYQHVSSFGIVCDNGNQRPSRMNTTKPIRASASVKAMPRNIVVRTMPAASGWRAIASTDLPTR